MWKDRQVTGFLQYQLPQRFFSMSDNKDVSGTGGGGNGVGAASAVREARAARRGADGTGPGVGSL